MAEKPCDSDGTIVTKKVNGYGPYAYRVTCENGESEWEYLGKVADNVTGSYQNGPEVDWEDLDVETTTKDPWDDGSEFEHESVSEIGGTDLGVIIEEDDITGWVVNLTTNDSSWKIGKSDVEGKDEAIEVAEEWVGEIRRRQPEVNSTAELDDLSKELRGEE